MRRIALVLAPLLVLLLAMPAAAPARDTSFDYFVGGIPNDHVLLLATVGPTVRAQRPFAVRNLDRASYLGAWGSAAQRQREANVFLSFTGSDEEIGALLALMRVTVGGFRGLRIYSLPIPYANGRVDTARIKEAGLPRLVLRATKSLVDTSTGEVQWADE